MHGVWATVWATVWVTVWAQACEHRKCIYIAALVSLVRVVIVVTVYKRYCFGLGNCFCGLFCSSVKRVAF